MLRTLPLLVAAATLAPAVAFAQGAFDARSFITVDIDNDPARRTNVPTETDYIPNVVVSENGLASFEALKAQAVAARSFAYWLLDFEESRNRPSVIGDGQGSQVYSGSASPRQIHFDAARATEGEILAIRDTFGGQRDVLVAPFYVAGAIPTAPFNDADPEARPAPGAPSTNNTERFVTYTYDAGLFGNDNRGSDQGFQTSPPAETNWPNRGTKSQNGADYLSDNSIDYLDILKYYYGADIQLRTVTTAGSGVTLGRKVLADFDDYGSGRISDGVIDGNEGVFNRSPTLSGSTVNVTGSTADRFGGDSLDGSHSQRIVIDYDEAAQDEFLVRHVAAARFSDFGGASNVATKVANLEFNREGSVGFWLKTTDPGVEVSFAIDDAATGDRGVRRPVIADGQWREYRWDLERADDWVSWSLGGDGELTGPRVSIDSIQFFGSADAEVLLDTVFWDSSVSFIPEPAGVALAGLAIVAASRRRRGR
ncbi:MAG: SpoIID/LytB domain-containing protein [Planctomycetota bacterium]